MSRDLYLASPRGFCAGVRRAIRIVEEALKKYERVFVRHEIVHNRFVVDRLRKKGVIFVEEVQEVPEESILIISAHGAPPHIFKDAEEKKLKVIDATCPLVKKVHAEAKKYSAKGYDILLIGHEKHVEVQGTKGVAPLHTQVVETCETAEKIQVKDSDKVVVLAQTTLSHYDKNAIEEILKRRFPNLHSLSGKDVCFATTNRQDAVRSLCSRVELLLVAGSKNSSNSNRLKEVAAQEGIRSYLIDEACEINDQWLEGIHKVGITAGASTPEEIIEGIRAFLVEKGFENVTEIMECEEKVNFPLPKI